MDEELVFEPSVVFPTSQQLSLQQEDDFYHSHNDGEMLVEMNEPAVYQTEAGNPTESVAEVCTPYHCHVPPEPVSTAARNQLIIVSILCITFMIVEIIGGVISNSLALITDATHLASDLAGFLVSLFSIWMAKRPVTKRMSFGFYRAEVIGALISVLIIWVATGILLYLAIKRIISMDYEIKADQMIITAGLGVAFNILMAAVLHSGMCACQAHSKFGHSHGGHGHSHSGHGHSHSHRHSHGDQSLGNANGTGLGFSNPLNSASEPIGCSASGDNTHNDLQPNSPSHVDVNSNAQTDATQLANSSTDVHKQTVKQEEKRNINVRAAFIHVIGDLIQSIGVLIAAYIIKFHPETKIADPICTFVFSLLVLITTITILRDAGMVLLEAVPKDLDYPAMRKDLQSIDKVKSVHSLHVWALTMDKNAAAVHLATDEDGQWQKIVESATALLRDKYHITYSTVQVEAYQEIMTSCGQCTQPT